MSFFSWLRRRQRSYSGIRRRAPADSGKRFRPRLCVEALEDRRLLSAGALDPTFGVGGKATADFLGPTGDFGQAVTAIQSDGKIVVAGNSDSAGGDGAALVRYNTNGSIDTTFGSGGKVVPDYTKFGGAIYAVAIQADGKIVIAGNTYFEQTNQGFAFALMRYNSDGSLDTTFGNGGLVATSFIGVRDFDTGFDFAHALAIQADGKIVAAGEAASDFALARYNSDGSLDTTFGTGGKVATTFAGSIPSIANGVAIQADGKIVADGWSYQSGEGSYDFALARYNSDGGLDTTFGSGGEVLTTFGSVTNEAFAVALQGDGKIVAAGEAYQSSSGVVGFALARYTTNGSLDSAFGNGTGEVITSFGSSINIDVANAVAIQSDGKIVAAGTSYFQPGAGNDFALARYNSDGSPDTGFGAGGRILTNFGSGDNRATGVALLQNSGGQTVAIVAAGSSLQPGTGYDFAVARYNSSDGSLDTTFGNGTVTTNIGQGPNNDFGHGGIALQADGKIVQAGVTEGVAGQDFALARYNSDGSLDTTFGTGGEVSTDFGGPAVASAEAIQADGKIVVVGETIVNNRFVDIAMARYNSDGSLDTAFGTGGEVVTDFGGLVGAANGVAIQADGKIVVAGAAGGSFFAVVRYNSDGSLDTNFGSGGVAAITFAGQDGEAESVALQADGKIVAAGSAFVSKTLSSDFALVRLNANGSLDSTFGSGGEVLTSFGGNGDQASAVAIQDNGQIVAVGTSNQQKVGFDFALARYNSNGSPDKTFGKNGEVLTNFASPDNEAFGMALQGDGKIVAAGESSQATGYEFALARYNSDGTLDPFFGNGGLVTTSFGGISQVIGVVIQADGNIVAGGTAFQSGTGFDFALARYIGVTPSPSIDSLIANVQALVDKGVLNNGQGNALLVKLQNAIEHLSDGQVKTAVNDLQAFVNEVNDFIGQGVLSSAVGQPLIDDANLVIALLTKK